MTAAAFSPTWPQMLAHEGRTGTVRTTNGGEATGTLSSFGTTYAIEVTEPSGHTLVILGARVAGVRLD